MGSRHLGSFSKTFYLDSYDAIVNRSDTLPTFVPNAQITRLSFSQFRSDQARFQCSSSSEIWKGKIVKMNEKQSLLILPPNSEKTTGSMNSVVESSEAEASTVSVTLGTVPKRRSWCCPLQLGIPRGHWSGGITESLWPGQPRIGSKESIVTATTISRKKRLASCNLGHSKRTWLGCYRCEGSPLRPSRCVSNEW